MWYKDGGKYKYPLYFVDNEGIIHTVFDDNNSTLTSCFDIKVGDNGGLTYRHLTDWEDGNWLVFEEYTLWNTLTELAKQIEGE